jgi:hypothetical protein
MQEQEGCQPRIVCKQDPGLDLQAGVLHKPKRVLGGERELGTPFPGSPAQGGQQAENGGSSLVASSKGRRRWHRPWSIAGLAYLAGQVFLRELSQK